ncbi:MAG: hypothetical protein EA416_16640 [Trueperaceae bacterium]|nr:MAG: hypothetical protein EA416_16640 [Trueperaceae bacterium]
MNRQLRRAQQKQDEKFDKERQKKKDKRQAKVSALKDRRSRRRAESLARAEARKRGETPAEAPKQDGSPAAKRKRPGRFSAALMMATVFFIVLQSAVPPENPGEIDVLRSVTSAGFYLLFAYFSTLWLMRRDTPRPIMMTLISGGMLTLGVEVAKYFQPDMTTDLLMLALAVPFLVAGAFLGRLVYVNSPT